MRRAALLSCVAAILAGALSGCSGHATAPVHVKVVQTTADLREALKRLPDLAFSRRAPGGVHTIHVDDSVRYQRVLGVGAAITDTSAWLIHNELPPAAREQLMRDLFGPNGIRLNVLRVPIGASDFTRTGRPYSYDDLPRGASDPGLTQFSVAHDAAYVLPTLREALALRPGIQTLASPWSPPGWMKANDSLSDWRRRGTLLPNAYGAFGRYLVRFIEAYRASGVPIDAITPQNEPGQATRYPGLNLSAAGEAKLIAGNLAPALRAARLRTRIYGLDFAWRHAAFARALVRDPPVRAALAGIAWHCYRGNPRVMDAIHRLMPGADQMLTECSGGIAPGPTAELVITAFRHWASAVILWNLALDPTGGPVQPPNGGCSGCTGVVTVSERTHTVRYGADYYQLGQFGSFVAPGAWRIASNTFVATKAARSKPRIDYVTAGLDDVAFRNPDGTDVVLVHNTARHAIPFAVSWRGRSVNDTVPAGATVTLSWR